MILFYAGLLGCESGSPNFGRCRLVPNQPFSLINPNFCTTMVSCIQSSCGLTVYMVVASVTYVPLAAGGWGHVQRRWDGKRRHRVLHRLGSLYLLLCMIPSIRPSLSQRPSRICAPCSLSPVLLHWIQVLLYPFLL